MATAAGAATDPAELSSSEERDERERASDEAVRAHEDAIARHRMKWLEEDALTDPDFYDGTVYDGPHGGAWGYSVGAPLHGGSDEPVGPRSPVEVPNSPNTIGATHGGDTQEARRSAPPLSQYRPAPASPAAPTPVAPAATPPAAPTPVAPAATPAAPVSPAAPASLAAMHTYIHTYTHAHIHTHYICTSAGHLAGVVGGWPLLGPRRDAGPAMRARGAGPF